MNDNKVFVIYRGPKHTTIKEGDKFEVLAVENNSYRLRDKDNNIFKNAIVTMFNVLFNNVEIPLGTNVLFSHWKAEQHDYVGTVQANMGLFNLYNFNDSQFIGVLGDKETEPRGITTIRDIKIINPGDLKYSFSKTEVDGMTLIHLPNGDALVGGTWFDKEDVKKIIKGFLKHHNYLLESKNDLDPNLLF